MILITLYDVKAEQYSPLQCHESIEAAHQFFSVLVNSHSDLPQHKFPEDFIMYDVGIFEVATGTIHTNLNPVPLGTLRGLKNECKTCLAEYEKDAVAIAEHYSKPATPAVTACGEEISYDEEIENE